jgi:hypothetical protein
MKSIQEITWVPNWQVVDLGDLLRASHMSASNADDHLILLVLDILRFFTLLILQWMLKEK